MQRSVWNRTLFSVFGRYSREWLLLCCYCRFIFASVYGKSDTFGFMCTHNPYDWLKARQSERKRGGKFQIYYKTIVNGIAKMAVCVRACSKCTVACIRWHTALPQLNAYLSSHYRVISDDYSRCAWRKKHLKPPQSQVWTANQR